MLVRLRRKGNLSALSWECRLVQPLWKTVWNFLRKLKMELPFDLAIPLLGLYPKNPEMPIQKNLYPPVFMAASFTIVKCWKQPKSPSVNEWIKKLWYGPGWCHSMDWVLACEPKGWRFNSQSGHMPGLQSPVGSNHTLMFPSLSFPLPSPLSKINK